MTTALVHCRGDTFDKTVTLTGAASYYTGGLRFTVRSAIPATSVVNDTDAVATATIGAGITIDGNDVRVQFAASTTNAWPRARLYWDLQGKVTETGLVKTIDSGELMIRADITRTP